MITMHQVEFGYPGSGFRLAIPDLEIGAGETVAIVGPSGSGKTTLLNLVAGIERPVRGRITVADEDVAALPDEDRQDFRALRMGLVFQEFELLDYLTVFENVLLPYRISLALDLNRDVHLRAESLLADVGLAGKRARFPRRLSQGERQRVAVCRALVTRPAILLGDEPTGNLDPENRDHVMDLLMDYAATEQAPLIVVTHDHHLAGRFDRILDVAVLNAAAEPATVVAGA